MHDDVSAFWRVLFSFYSREIGEENQKDIIAKYDEKDDFFTCKYEWGVFILEPNKYSILKPLVVSYKDRSNRRKYLANDLCTVDSLIEFRKVLLARPEMKNSKISVNPSDKAIYETRSSVNVDLSVINRLKRIKGIGINCAYIHNEYGYGFILLLEKDVKLIERKKNSIRRDLKKERSQTKRSKDYKDREYFNQVNKIKVSINELTRIINIKERWFYLFIISMILSLFFVAFVEIYSFYKNKSTNSRPIKISTETSNSFKEIIIARNAAPIYIMEDDIPDEIRKGAPATLKAFLEINKKIAEKAYNPVLEDLKKLKDVSSDDKLKLAWAYYTEGTIYFNQAVALWYDGTPDDILDLLDLACLHFYKSFKLDNTLTRAALDYRKATFFIILQEYGVFVTTDWKKFGEEFQELKMSQLTALHQALPNAKLKSEVYGPLIWDLISIGDYEKAKKHLIEWEQYYQSVKDLKSKELFMNDVFTFLIMVDTMGGDKKKRLEYIGQGLKMGFESGMIILEIILEYNEEQIKALCHLLLKYGLGKEALAILNEYYDLLKKNHIEDKEVGNMIIMGLMLDVKCMAENFRYKGYNLDSNMFQDFNADCYDETIKRLSWFIKNNPYGEGAHFSLGLTLHSLSSSGFSTNEKNIRHKANSHILTAVINSFCHTYENKQYLDAFMGLNRDETDWIFSSEDLKYVDPECNVSLDKLHLPNSLKMTK